MVIIYLLGKLLEKKDDYKFQQIWENRFLKYTRFWLGSLGIFYLVIISLITSFLTLGDVFFLFVILIFIFVAVIYGYYLFRTLLRFIATQNQRYFEIKMMGPTERFSKDNVVN